MIFWLGIIVAAIFAYTAVKLGFFMSWSILFNIIISVYLAIYLGPFVVIFIPGAGDTPYANILAMVGVGLASFFIQHLIAYSYITGPFAVSFPRILDNLGAMIIGFFSGFMVWSFISLMVCMMPISRVKFLEDLGLGCEKHQSTVAYVTWWCDKIDRFVAIDYDPNTTSKT
ncbi:MAG: CvpA family protein, partial [Planctomycetota bacterium]